MIAPWAYLSAKDRDILSAAVAFLHKRLAEQDTIDWALRLAPGQSIKRLAVEQLLDGRGARDLDEPWATAWRLIQESWATEREHCRDETTVYRIQERLRAGERSGAVVADTVLLVAPRLKVEPIDPMRWMHVKRPRAPKAVDDILSAHLTSGDLIDLNLLGISEITDIPFLMSLATALEAAVVRGLDIARRLGWDRTRYFFGSGSLARVYYTRPARGVGEDSEPDAYHRGMAPSVKLLHEVAARIADLTPQTVKPFLQRWETYASPIFTRLWAAMARNGQVASADQVSAFLLESNNDQFWDLDLFPEIAELRALRFGGLEKGAQETIIARLRKGPPRSHWPRKADSAKVKDGRLYWTVRELRRIEAAGGIIPRRSKMWLDEKTTPFPELATIAIDSGFPEGVIVRSVPRNPDDRFNTLQGVARLTELEKAFETSRSGWGDDPADRANDWLHQSENAVLILSDFESVGNGGDDFPVVWNRFGWAHTPKASETTTPHGRDLPNEAERVLALLTQLSAATLLAAIEGISEWLDRWQKQVAASPRLLPVWMRLWPIAVDATNSRPEKEGDLDLNAILPADDDREPWDSDTVSTPAGKLVGVFLAICPNLGTEPHAFAVRSRERQMRDAVISAEGHSGLIARHRLVEWLPYFLRVDRDWAQEHLISPLRDNREESVTLWRAVARRTRFTDVLEIIGDTMVRRATDLRLGRETRRSLVFSLVIESLHAFREGRDPAVPNPQIQQMLRTLDDEARASAADAVQRFVSSLSAESRKGRPPLPAEEVFRSAADPFLREVWPQERSLVTPGVAAAFADLPASSGDAFVEAVDAVERFLVPFDCWTMFDFGLRGVEDGNERLAVINDRAKASALLRLLDLTVGTAEGAVVPHDLTNALDQVRSVAADLATTPAYRRLATAARR